MNKFSLYDLLGLLLPGFILTWLLNQLISVFQLSQYSLISNTWDSKLGLVFCLSLVLGALLYSLNFWLARLVKNNTFGKTGIYGNVAQIYMTLKFNADFCHTLNQQAQKWFEQSIYYKNEEFKELTEDKQKELTQLQDEFYDRMYYELEYVGKLEYAKSFQSFYFFFRQLFSACWITFITSLILWGLSTLSFNWILAPAYHILYFTFITLATAIFLSSLLAKWYRKRMVLKMYWSFYTHINQTLNK